MNYYDHAVMITYRLGPWAEAGGIDHREHRCPPRREPLSAVIRRLGQAFELLRHTRIRLVRADRQSHPATGDCKTITKA